MFSRMSLNTFPSVLIGINVTWLSDVLVLRSFSASKLSFFREFKLFKIYVWSYIILVFLLWLGLYIFREKYVVVFRQQLMSMRKITLISREQNYRKPRLYHWLLCLQFVEMFTFYQVPVMLRYQFWGVWSWFFFFLLFIATSEVIAGLVVIQLSSDKWKPGSVSINKQQ